jgi:hypothetical protein
MCSQQTAGASEAGLPWALAVFAACAALVGCALAGCEGKRVGPALELDAGGGNGGATLGTGGSGATLGTGGSAPGTGGSGVGGGGSGSGGSGSPCLENEVRGPCPNPEICAAGAWSPATGLQCAACGIVSCPAGFSPCCAGFGTFGLTAFTYVAHPAVLRGLTAASGQVAADFMFTEAYEVGAIQFLLSSEVPIRSVNVRFTYTGDVYPDFSMEREAGVHGAAYNINSITGEADLALPERCFPDTRTCATTFNQIDIRLRPYGPGPARLVVTSIVIGT